MIGVTLVASAMLQLGAGTAGATVTAVSGQAFGFSTTVSLFGGPQMAGPAPSVTLAPDASNSPQSATFVSATAQFGPATVFSSGPLTVSTSGALGAGGFATSSSAIEEINRSGEEVFTAIRATSSCTASESGVGGSTTITGGRLEISDGDPNIPGDETVVTLPANPAPNMMFEGVINAVGDRFQYIFNEQVVGPDGSLTVHAAHQRLLGPTAVGDVFIGKSHCGVTSVDATAPSIAVEQAAGQADPTSTAPIGFTVTFSEPVTGFDAGDVSFAGSSVGGALAAAVTGGPSSYDIAVTGMTTTGTVVASIAAGAAIDSAGNASGASTSTDNTVNWVAPDSTAPTMTCSASPSQVVPGSNNHKLIDVDVSVTVDDSGSGAAGFRLLSATSSQADSGLDEGDVPDDVRGWSVGTPDTSGQVRTERYRTARVYTLSYEGLDEAGNTASCATTVTVPKGS